MTEKTYSTASGIIHYWTNGINGSDAVTLVFLPGLTADHRLFDRQIEYFKDKFNGTGIFAIISGKTQRVHINRLRSTAEKICHILGNMVSEKDGACIPALSLEMAAEARPCRNRNIALRQKTDV